MWRSIMLALGLSGSLQAATPTPLSSSPVPSLVVTSPDVAQMERAMLWYGREDYAAALQEFQELVRTYPNSNKREESLYRLAECYRRLQRPADAMAAFQFFLKSCPESLFVPAAELRLGELLTQQRQFQDAIPHLTRVQGTADATSRGFARYYLSTCWEETGHDKEARPLLEEITTQNPAPSYLLPAVIRLAALLERVKEPDKALELWKRVPELTSDSALCAQAAARAGWICLQKDKGREAETFFAQARKNDKSGDWRRLANTGLLRLYFQQKRDEEAAALFAAERSLFLESLRESVLFQGGTSLFRLKRYAESVSVFDEYLKDFAQSESGAGVAYQRLVARRELSRNNVELDTALFLRTYATSIFANQVRLFQAEDWMRTGKFSEAATAWEALSGLAEKDLQLPAEIIASETGRAHFCAGHWPEAAGAYLKFADAYPKSSRSLDALQQAAIALQKAHLLQQAVQAWERVRLVAPDKSTVRQTALEQLALIFSQMSQPDAAARAFEDLLAMFPETRLKALAAYTVGARAFEKKDDAKARPFLLLARDLDASTWAIPATERLIYAAHRQKDENPLALHLAEYDELRKKPGPLLKPMPALLFYWLADTRFKRGEWAAALPYFQQVTTAEDAGSLLAGSWWQLGLCQLRTRAGLEAIDSFEHYRRLQPKEARSSEFVLALGEAHFTAKSYETARTLAEQLMLQEPEGNYNARARLLTGEVSMARKEYADAAKAFAAVALLYRDAELTPLAMRRAADAFELAGDKASALSWRQKLKTAP